MDKRKKMLTKKGGLIDTMELMSHRAKNCNSPGRRAVVRSRRRRRRSGFLNVMDGMRFGRSVASRCRCFGTFVSSNRQIAISSADDVSRRIKSGLVACRRFPSRAKGPPEHYFVVVAATPVLDDCALIEGWVFVGE